MGNELQPKQSNQSPLVQLRSTLLATVAANKDRLGGVINQHHVLMAMVAIEANPRLLLCTQESIWGCIVRAANYRWVCDPAMGQCAIVPFNNIATLIPEYRGWIDLVARAGADVVMDCVHDGDTIEWRGMFQEPIHTRSRNPRRRFLPFSDAYVVIRHRQTGAVRAESWTVGECIAHRDRYSKNWALNRTESNPWHEKNPAFRVMCMKTVLLEMVHRGAAPLAIEDRPLAVAALQHERLSTINISSITTNPNSSHAPLPALPSTNESADITETTPQIVSEVTTTQSTPTEEEELASLEVENQFKELILQQKVQSDVETLLQQAEKNPSLLQESKDRVRKFAEDHITSMRTKRHMRSGETQKSMIKDGA